MGSLLRIRIDNNIISIRLTGSFSIFLNLFQSFSKRRKKKTISQQKNSRYEWRINISRSYQNNL